MENKEFKIDQLDNFSRDHKNFTLFALGLGLFAILGVVTMYFSSISRVHEAEGKTWIVDRNSAPFKAQVRGNLNYPERIYEFEGLIKEFYSTYFTWDEYSFKENLELALHIAETETGKNLRLKFEENQIEKHVVEDGWIYEGKVDSIIWLDNRQSGIAYGKQRIQLKSKEVWRNMYFNFKIINLPGRSRENPWAAKLSDIDIFNNQVIKTKEKHY